MKQRVDSFEAPDAYTVVVKTKEPYAWALDSLGSAAGAAVIPKPLIDAGTDLRTQGAGSGPYYLDQYRDGEVASVNRNPDFWSQPRPWMDGIDYRIVLDRAARRTAFLSQQIDLYYPQNVREAEDLTGQDDRITVSNVPSLYYASVNMRADKEPFTDERVRKAIALGVNRDDYINRLAFGEGKPNGPVSWSLDYWAIDQEEVKSLQPFDPEEAKSLLSAAGYDDGLTVPVVHPEQQQTVEHLTILLEQMKAIGVNLDLQVLPLTAWYYDRFQKGDFIMTVAYLLPYENPARPLRYMHTMGVQGDGSWHGYSDPEVDAAIDEMDQTVDRTACAEKCKEVQRLIIAKNPPQLNIFSAYDYTAIWDYVMGSRSDLRSLSLFNPNFWLNK
jgi:peptide/nickel transport system substrate-binding protein